MKAGMILLMLGVCVLADAGNDVSSLVDRIHRRQQTGDIHDMMQSMKKSGLLNKTQQYTARVAQGLTEASGQAKNAPLKTKYIPSHSKNLLVFVSFSMPQATLLSIAKAARKTGATVLLRGLRNDSLRQTMHAAYTLTQKTGAGFAIDPVAFSRFHITQVPAWVVFHDTHSGVVFGDVSADYALTKIVQRTSGDVRTIAQSALKQYRKEVP